MEKIIVTTLKEIEQIFENVIQRHVTQEKHNTSETSSTDTQYLTRQETAKILSISLPTLSKHERNGKIASYRIGSRVLFKKSDIEAAIEQRNFTS